MLPESGINGLEVQSSQERLETTSDSSNAAGGQAIEDIKACDQSISSSMTEYMSAMRLVRSRLGGCAAVAINPVSTIFALLILAGLVIFSALAGKEGSSMLQNFVFYGTEDTMALAGQLSSFFLVSVAFWLLFMLYVGIAHGHKKLGGPEDKPEYSDFTYFCLIFTAAAAMGIYFYGVSEGLGNQGPNGPNRFARSPFLTQNQQDQYAMDLSMFNWGVNTFAPYSLVGVLIGYQHFTRGLPMTTRSLFYDFLGDYTWGWLGDLIDGYSIVSVMSGLLASLGISVESLISGFVAFGWMDGDMTDHDIKVIQSIIVAAIIACATISVATGINTGIKHLATFAMVGSTSLWLMVFALENKPYVLNLLSQTFGNYVWSIVPFSFHSDAFAQLLPGQGAQLDQTTAAEEWWVTYYPLFYFCWSMSWAPFVGTFYAKVSKGRTVRECLTYTLLVSFSYYLLWFVLFSGGGIRMQRRAFELQQLGDLNFNDSQYFVIPGRVHCYRPPLEPVEYVIEVDGENVTYTYVNREPDVTAVCLSTGNSAEAWFDYLRQFSSIGHGLCVLSIICMFFFFITTSDSTSLVFDLLSSNGDEQHTWLQRCVWSLLQAALTITLIWGGDEAGSALKSAQALCIIASIPNAIMLDVACINLLYSFRAGQDNESANFRMPMYGGVFDIIEYAFSLGKMNSKRGPPGAPSSAVWSTFALSLFAPFYVIYRINHEKTKKNRILTSAFVCFTFLGWIVSMAAQVWPIAFMFYVWLVFAIAATRNATRTELGIRGNLLEDLFTTFIMYPNVLSQIAFQGIDREVSIHKDDLVSSDTYSNYEESLPVAMAIVEKDQEEGKEKNAPAEV